MSVESTKEELLKKEQEQEAKDKLKQEEQRQRDIVKNIFYPFLLEKSASIMDAKNIVMAANALLEASFHARVAEEQKRLSVAKLTEVHYERELKPDNKMERELALLELFKDEPIATTNALLTGMFQAIESFEREEATNRNLSTLKATFL